MQESSGSRRGNWSSEKPRGKEAEIQTLFGVALQRLGVPAPQPCSPEALAAGPTGEASWEKRAT